MAKKDKIKIKIREKNLIKFNQKINKMALFASSADGVEVGYNANYAAFVEYGTKYMKAQPYFEPAINKVESTLKSRLKELGTKLLKGTEREKMALKIKAVGLDIINISTVDVPVDTANLKKSVYIKKL
tara:strand:- start:697 stop:1080 length:384 start_codon:yes stop_codon:yes gene_type:complete